MTEIIYNGVDITKDLRIKQCVLHDNAGKYADDADIIFPDGERIWRSWNPVKGDNIIIKADNYSTGLMHIDNITQGAGVFNIKATSVPLSAKKKKTHIWRNVKLTEIIADIAKNNSLIVKTYGINDYTYLTVSQIEQSDIGFLNYLCVREGYCCKVTDGKLVVFSEKYMESFAPSITITPEDLKPEYEFNRSDDILQSFNVRFYINGRGLISYTASDNTIAGGADERIEPLSSIAEAERWSKGYLRYKNKYKITAWLPMKYLSKIAAASVITASGFGFFDGKYYIDQITHDTVNNMSYATVRQTIENY